MAKSARKRSPFLNSLEYRLVLTVSFLISLLPRMGMVRMGRFLGRLGYRFWGGRRAIAIDNLDRAFGDTKSAAEKDEIARQSFESVGVTLMELAWGMRRMNEKICAGAVRFENLDLLMSVLAEGRGAIILPAHYGNWEIMANAFGYLGHTAYFVAKRLKSAALDALINDYRCRTGNKVIYMNGASTEMEEALRNGNIVATALDQKVPVRRGGILVDFFGRPAASTPFIAELHFATQAPMIHIRNEPQADGTCRIICGPVETFEPTDDHEQDVHELTQQCMKTLEDYIRATPQFWIWAHKRWKLGSH